MKRVAAKVGLVALLLGSGLALSACVAPEPYYGYGAPAYYGQAPAYYGRPAQQTFVFSYSENDRRGPPRHRRYWH